MVPNLRGRAIAGLLLGGLFGQACAQGIFTCVDAKGRQLTADRPIIECIDREQKELNSSGTVKRKLAPSLTAQEREAEEERSRKLIEARNRLAEDKKRDRALLTRYPDRPAHDKERLAALSLVDETIAVARKSTGELVALRKRLETEMEFYLKDPSRVPAKLKRQLEENEQHIEAQRRFVANQESEKRRINARFDEELAKLKQVWAQRAASLPTAKLPGAATP
jgi:hypothetical protein